MNESFSQNKWKYATIAVLGVLAIVITTPQATAATDNTQLVQQILNIVKSTVYGNAAIKTAVDSANTKLNALRTSVGDIDISNLDVAVSTRATQTSVDAIAGNSLEIRSVAFSGAFSASENSSLRVFLNCDEPYVVYSIRVETDSFKVFHLSVGGFEYLFDTLEHDAGGGWAHDLIQEVGSPIVGFPSPSELTNFTIEQTQIDEEGDTLRGDIGISVPHSTDCTLSTSEPF